MDLPNHDSQSASSTQKNMESSLYELRILNGLHQGARTNALPQMLIGSDHECDIILRDQDVAPQLATLHVESTGWKVSANGIQIPHAELSFGQAIRLGSIIVSVASQQAPWPTEDKLQDIIVAQALPAELDTSPVEDEQKTDALSEDHETKSEGNSETDSEDSTTSAELSESSRKVWQAYLDTAQQKLDQILIGHR